MRHQAITLPSWKQQAVGELRAYSQSGNFFLAGDVDGNGIADVTVRTNILMLQADIIL
ncbi:MAG: hypothetical protein QOD42_550 [Sphingomonadales bacterium]|jgi:hypothetical protein|nr:hypothetical protein [Sphingomonadales bacterium]